MRLHNYIHESEDPLTDQDLKNLEMWADKLFAAVGLDIAFTKHFKDRVNDERNKKQITFQELVRLFRETYKKYGRKIAELSPNIEGVIKDLETDLNMPFALSWDRNTQELDLVAKTVMRKKGFKTPNREFVLR
jgi:hypothetical protein